MGNRRITSVFRWLSCTASLGSLCLLLGFAPTDAGSVKSSKGKSLTHTDQYVGSQACATCHKAIYANYLQTAMGHSVVRVTQEWVEGHHVSGSLEDKNSQLQFEVYSQDGKLYQSERQSGPDGREIFRDMHEVEWIIGAGENGYGGLIRRGDHLFQAPLSFYAKPGRWELSPGYEIDNLGFNRPILPGCISCHSGRPNTVADGNGRFADPPFSEMPIGCENCHGPGLAHVSAEELSPSGLQGGDSLIVNPASLSPTLSDNICISCHQTGDVRVLKPGKNNGDFRPGAPLDDTMSILMVPP